VSSLFQHRGENIDTWKWRKDKMKKESLKNFLLDNNKKVRVENREKEIEKIIKVRENLEEIKGKRKEREVGKKAYGRQMRKRQIKNEIEWRGKSEIENR